MNKISFPLYNGCVEIELDDRNILFRSDIVSAGEYIGYNSTVIGFEATKERIQEIIDFLTLNLENYSENIPNR